MYTKKWIIGFSSGCFVAFLFFYLFLGIGVRRLSWDGEFLHRVVSFFPYPALMVNYQFVSLNEFFDDTKALYLFTRIQNQAGGLAKSVDRNEIKKIVEDQFVNRELIQDRLRSYGKKITQQAIDEEFALVVSSVGSEEKVKDELKRLYGWDIVEFKDKVVRYKLMEEILSKSLAEDMSIPENKEAWENIKKIRERLLSGESFDEVARSESEDTASTANGGLLGEVTRGMMVKSFEDVAFSLEPGTLSDVVVTPYGYHLIKVDSSTPDGEGVIKSVSARHILIRSIDLPVYLERIRDEATIFRFIK